MSAETDLINLIISHFSEDELRELCIDLSIDYESLSGENKRRKAQELVTYAKRRNLSAQLLATIGEKRPFLKSQLNSINLSQTGPITDPINTRLPILIGFGVVIIILLGFGLWSAYRSVDSDADTAVPTTAEESFTYQVRVQDKSSDTPLANAKVTIDLPGTLPVDQFSDNNGLVAFNIDEKFDGENVFLHVRMDGYENWDQNINIAAGERPYEVQLAPVP